MPTIRWMGDGVRRIGVFVFKIGWDTYWYLSFEPKVHHGRTSLHGTGCAEASWHCWCGNEVRFKFMLRVGLVLYFSHDWGLYRSSLVGVISLNIPIFFHQERNVVNRLSQCTRSLCLSSAGARQNLLRSSWFSWSGSLLPSSLVSLTSSTWGSVTMEIRGTVSCTYFLIVYASSPGRCSD